MIQITIRSNVVVASGLTPGEDIHLDLDGTLFLIHRHGPVCHVHEAKGGTR